jgi:hypothetical protein
MKRRTEIKKVIKTCLVERVDKAVPPLLTTCSGNWKPRGSRSKTSKTLNGRRLRENVARSCVLDCAFSPDCRASASPPSCSRKRRYSHLLSLAMLPKPHSLFASTGKPNYRVNELGCCDIRNKWWASFYREIFLDVEKGSKETCVVHERNKKINMYSIKKERFLLDKTGHHRLVR